MGLSNTALVLLLIPAVVSAVCPSGSIYDSQFNRCYKFDKALTPFLLAEESCVSVGGHLASVGNGFENALLVENAKQFFRNADFWIGANTLASSNWSWTDNNSFRYVNWLVGEPKTGKNCAAISQNTSYWVSDSCSNAKPFVCVIPQQVITPAPCTTANIYHCDSEWTFFDVTSSCYKVLLNENFDNAEATCKAMGSHLTSIHSKAENDFVAALAGTGLTLGWDQQAWIGMRRDSKGAWMNVDGTKVDYFNWGKGQPDDAKGKENCVQMLPDELSGKHNDGLRLDWNDIQCTDNMRAYICKKPAYHN